jgi:hypothetical protein
MTGDENASITISIVTFFIETVKRPLGRKAPQERGHPVPVKPRTANPKLVT